MSSQPQSRRWHLPHLLLIALLPLTWHVAAGFTPAAPAFLAGWLILNLGILAAGERWRPYRRDWTVDGRRMRRDGSIVGINVIVDATVGALLTALAIACLPGRNAWPLGLQILAGLLAAEFASYWLHRWSHAGGWLWKVHVMHHLPDRLNASNALMAHPINAGYEKVARLAPLLLLGLSPEAMLAVALFGITQALSTHANIAGTIGPLNWLLGSAELHRLHHSTNEAEAGNFGTCLPLWDQLFGTYRRGQAPMEVGVFEPAHYPSEFALTALLGLPFKMHFRRLVQASCCCCLRAR